MIVCVLNYPVEGKLGELGLLAAYYKVNEAKICNEAAVGNLGLFQIQINCKSFLSNIKFDSCHTGP